jgi:hypothetical protein
MPSRPPAAPPAGPRNPGEEILTCGHRPLVALALVALLAAPAIAQPPASRYDIRSYGTVQGGENPVANRKAIQAAHDAAKAAGGGIVYIPAGRLLVDRPVAWDGDGVGCAGDGMGLSVIESTGTWPPIYVGLRRVLPGEGPFSADHFVDATGKVDTSAGQRWGICTKGDSYLVSAGSALALGPPGGWPSVKALTFDALIDFGPTPLSAAPASYPLCGVSADETAPGPWQFRADPNYGLQVIWKTGDGINRNFNFGNPAQLVGVKRLAWQIDFEHGAYLALIDKVQAATQTGPNGVWLGAGWKPGLKFVTNEFSPFMVGFQGAGLGRPGPAITVLGLHVTPTCRYGDVGVGQPQHRLDAASISGGDAGVNDANTYYYQSPNTLAYFLFADNPSGTDSVVPDRFVKIRCGAAIGTGHPDQWAYYASAGHASPWSSTGRNTFKDLTLRCGRGYGHAFMIGLALDLELDHVEAIGGAYGIGTFPAGVKYPITILDCTVSGDDSALFLSYAIVRSERLTVHDSGRTSIRLMASGATFRDTFIKGNGFPESVVKIHAGDTGGSYAFDGMVADWETDLAPTKNFIDITAHYFTPGTRLLVRNWGSTGGAPGSVLIDLHDGPPSAAKRAAVLNLSGIAVDPTPFSAIVRTDGPFWRGKVPAEDNYPGVPWVANAGPDGVGNVLIDPLVAP